MKSSELHPWPVLRSFVLELSSYDVPNVIDRAGLHVDWLLTKEQDYSNKTRIAAYRSRIDNAHALLNEEMSLRAAFIITDELVQRGCMDKLQNALHAIGWYLEDGKLIPDSQPVHELFFPKLSHHDAYIKIRSILQTAQLSIKVVDPYIDQSFLTFLGSVVQLNASIQILTSTKKIPKDLSTEMNKWRTQYNSASIEIRTTEDFHDRFIILDNSACWHIGCSIKDAGNKAFMLNQVEDRRNCDALIKVLTVAWSESKELK